MRYPSATKAQTSYDVEVNVYRQFDSNMSIVIFLRKQYEPEPIVAITTLPQGYITKLSQPRETSFT